MRQDKTLLDTMRRFTSTLTPMQAWLRDHDRSFDEIETRRKTEIQKQLQAMQNGEHPFICVLNILESVLGIHHGAGHLAQVEDEKTARKRAGHYFKTYHFDRQAENAAWAESMLTKDIPSLEMTRAILARFMQPPERGGDRSWGINRIHDQLNILARNESFDFTPHRLDAYVGDILETLRPHGDMGKPEDWFLGETRDAFQLEQDIELRRMVEIVDALKAWREGTHPFVVALRAVNALEKNYQNPLSRFATYAAAYHSDLARLRADHVSDTAESEKNKERSLLRCLEDQKNLARDARAIVHQMREEGLVYAQNPQAHPEFAAQIDTFIAHVESGEEDSFSALRGVAEAIFAPVDDDAHAQDIDLWTVAIITGTAPMLSLLRKLIADRAKAEQESQKATKPMGALHTQSESEIKKPLKAIFNRRARMQKLGYYTPWPRLVDDVRIDASGSGMIKPYPYLSDGSWEEDLYGTVTARITTYNIAFKARDVSDVRRVAGLVRTGLKTLARRVEPAFLIPDDSDSEPYNRPYAISKNSYGTRRRGQTALSSRDTLAVDIMEGGWVRVHTRLDLDDVWNMYYLLEDSIEPSAAIARAFDAARRVEARGLLESKFDMGHDYSNAHRDEIERMGSLEDVDPANYVPAMMDHSLQLYALGEIDEEQFLHRVVVMSDQTLSGRMVDPVGVLPSYKAITDQSQNGRAIVTYDEALRARVREVLMIMTDTQDDTRALIPALIQKVSEISRPLRKKLREAMKKRAADMYERIHAPIESDTLADIFDRHGLLREEEEKPIPMIDRLVNSMRAMDEKAKKDPAIKKALAQKANIALRGEDVGTTTDRTWRDTAYVSRMRESLWVRKELPSALKPFIQTGERPDMQQMVRALSFIAK